MRVWKKGALALSLAAATGGCVPMPKIEPVEKTAAAWTGIGEPFRFKIEREAKDVGDPIAGGGSLSLDAAVRLALAHDPGLQAALARVRQAEADAHQQRLLPNPILALAVRFPTGGGRPDIEASVAADLLSLLLRPGRISAVDQRLRKSTADALVVVLDVLADVQQQYSKAQALAARIKIDDARRGTLGELLRVTEARTNSGEAARLDLLTVQGQLASLEAELLSRRSESRRARLILARMIGEPSASAEWTLDAWSPPAAIMADESAWVALALDRRPELQSIAWELAALGQDFRVARWSTLITASEIGPDAERSEGNWAIGPGAAVAVPLLDTGQAQRAKVSARVVEQRHELTRVERQIVQEIRVALDQVRSARAAVLQVEQRLIPIQRERLDQAKNAYRSGLADVLTVHVAEEEFQAALSRQIDLQEQLSQANHQLTRAVGGPPPAANATEQITP